MGASFWGLCARSDKILFCMSLVIKKHLSVSYDSKVDRFKGIYD